MPWTLGIRLGDEAGGCWGQWLTCGLQPYARSFDTHSPALGFLAVVLATMGISDLVSLSLPEEVCLFQHWAMQGNLAVLPSPPNPPGNLAAR